MLTGIQHMNAAELRGLIAALPGASGTQILRASDANTYASSFDFARHERPLADDDIAGWRIAAATMLARDQIRESVGQLSNLESIVLVDDVPNGERAVRTPEGAQVLQQDGTPVTETTRAGWHKIEYWLGKRDGSLTANTTGFVEDQEALFHTNKARIAFPRSAVEAASRAADLLAGGRTVDLLEPADQKALQMYTSTAPHEAIHASTYNSPKIPGIEWQTSVSVHPFTEGLDEAATADNYRLFSDRILGPSAGYLSDERRAAYGYPKGQLEPMRRIAALAGEARAPEVLLRNAAAVRIGQQAPALIREVAPNATPSQVEALATAALTLAHERAQKNVNSSKSEAVFSAMLDSVARTRTTR